MIYFNNAADSFPKLECVNHFLGNPEYFLTGRECKCQSATQKSVTDVFRSKIKDILNIPDEFQVTITSSATESANLVIQSFYKQSNSDNYIVYDYACHNSVIRPCQELYGEHRCFIHTSTNHEPCYFEKDKLIELCNSGNRKLQNCDAIIFSYQSNITGSICRNLKELIEFINSTTFNIPLIIDVTQSIGNSNFDLKSLIKGITYRNIYIFGTTHKSLGSISGTGFLVHPVNNKLIPLMYGGTGIGDFKQPREFPYYLESGTYNITSLVCANKAIDYSMSFIDIEQEAKSQLVNYFIKKFNEIYTKTLDKYIVIQKHWINPSSGIINLFPKSELIGEFLATDLFKRGFVTRFGCHCCSRYIYVDGENQYKLSLRISFNSQNTNHEIDQFFEAFINSIIEIAANDR
jgi:selenocysteine lyase/cysteine desulfurase